MKQYSLKLAVVLLIGAVLYVFQVGTTALSVTGNSFRTFLPLVIRSTDPPPTATLEPTATVEPTATSGPTPTATTAPTDIPPTGVQILPNTFHYVNIIDYLHVVGEVHNYTGSYLRFVRISANFWNAANELVATDYTYTWLDNLPPGEKTCFELSVEEPVGWTHYDFEAPTYNTSGRALPNLAVVGASGSVDSTFDWYEIIGQIRNDHGSEVRFVSPVGTVYNAQGQATGCDFTYVNSTDLQPGQLSSFELTFSGRNYNDVASWRVQVDGNPQ